MADKNKGSQESTRQRTGTQDAGMQERSSSQHEDRTRQEGNMPDRDRERERERGDQGGSRGGSQGGSRGGQQGGNR